MIRRLPVNLAIHLIYTFRHCISIAGMSTEQLAVDPFAQRRIAFRVREQVPGLRIIADDEKPPTG